MRSLAMAAPASEVGAPAREDRLNHSSIVACVSAGGTAKVGGSGTTGADDSGGSAALRQGSEKPPELCGSSARAILPIKNEAQTAHKAAKQSVCRMGKSPSMEKMGRPKSGNAGRVWKIQVGN
jgi:hypothetical protein